MTGAELLFFAGKYLGAAFLPPLNLVILAAFGLAIMARRPALARWLIGLGLTGLTLLSLPLVANNLIRVVETPCQVATPGLADAIVILGGGVRRVSPEYGGVPSVKVLALERLRYGASLYRQTGVPILVTGGALAGYPAEGPLMRDTLEQEFKVPVTWVEEKSWTTRTNAEFSAALLKPAGIQRIYLVSQGWHLRRAIPEFERLGFTVVAAGTGCEPTDDLGWSDFIPDPQALQTSYFAFHEILGLAWYGLIHRLT